MPPLTTKIEEIETDLTVPASKPKPKPKPRGRPPAAAKPAPAPDGPPTLEIKVDQNFLVLAGGLCLLGFALGWQTQKLISVCKQNVV